jgi:predicted transcriptional regulator
MKWGDIPTLVNGTVICGENRLADEVSFAFASDLMSDVLTLQTNKFMLITGLVNLQTIRTCEMADVYYVVMVRNKKVPTEIIALAKENGISIIKSPYSMFKTCEVLSAAGIRAIY